MGLQPLGALEIRGHLREGKAKLQAYVPDLPGCVAAGKILKETQRLIREAIALHLQGMREDGVQVPVPTSIAAYVDVLAKS